MKLFTRRTTQSIVEMLMHYEATWNGVEWRHCSRWNSKAFIFLIFLRKRTESECECVRVSFGVKSCAIDSNATNIDQSEIMQLSNFPFEQQSMSATHTHTDTISVHYAVHRVCCVVWLWWRKSHPFILLRFKLFAFVHFLYQSFLFSFFLPFFVLFIWGRVDSVSLVSALRCRLRIPREVAKI